MPMTGLPPFAAAVLAAVALLAAPAIAPASGGTAAATEPVTVAVVAPITVPPGSTGLLDAATLLDYTSEGGLLDRELDAIGGTLTTLGLDPMIPASIRVLGASAPQEALDFLERLRGLPNEVFLLGYADADPALAVAAGVEDDFAPLGFGFAIRPGDFGPVPDDTPVPSPTATEDTGGGDEPTPPPTTEELLSWPSTLPAIAWPAEGTVTADGLAGLAGLGYSAVLLGGANVPAAPGALVDLGDIHGLVIDDELTAAVRAAVYATGTNSFETAAVGLGTVLRTSTTASPRTLVATLDRRWPQTAPRLAQTLQAIASSGSARLTTLAGVLAGDPVPAVLTEPADTSYPGRADTLAELGAAAEDEAGYLRIADDPEAITEPRRLARLALASAGWRDDAAGWEAAAAEVLDATRSTLDAVQIVEGSDQLLLSDISSLRLQISNSLPVAVSVRLNVRALRPLLHIETPSVVVRIEPDSTATATVPVQAITNGEVIVRAELRASDGTQVGSARLLKVILQAGWETAGTLVAGALLVVVFGAGLVRTVLRRRRTRAGQDETTGDG